MPSYGLDAERLARSHAMWDAPWPVLYGTAIIGSIEIAFRRAHEETGEKPPDSDGCSSETPSPRGRPRVTAWMLMER